MIIYIKLPPCDKSFRINNKSLTVGTTIDADENASAAGPLAVADTITLTVASGGNLVIAGRERHLG